MTLHLTADGPRRSRTQTLVAGGFAILAITLVGAGLFANVNRGPDLARLREMSRVPQAQSSSPVAPLNLVKPLTPEQAMQQNSERPFDATPDTPAREFRLRADQNSRGKAIDCLTQAVYYEAATESADGQRAVAQVILNRMRHPGFPSTVCGVVYEGSQLPTGCQFTFTCDGSLMRTPVPALWSRARKIAEDALAGHVFAAVGHATHYHADYVLPYWADSLLKQVQIGHHIFYRLKGGLGSDAAFSQRYAGKEPDLPAPSAAVAIATQATDQAQALLNTGLVDNKPPAVAADAAGLAAAGAPAHVLIADNSKGSLLSDQGRKLTAPSPTAKRKAQTECTTVSSKKIEPATPEDLRARTPAGGC